MHSAADHNASGHSDNHNMATVGGCYSVVRWKPPESADALAEDCESPPPGRFHFRTTPRAESPYGAAPIAFWNVE
jgi:hypothetical protein